MDGSVKDYNIAQKIIELVDSPLVFNNTGQKLSETVKFVSNAKFTIANDTALIHISAALDVPFVCIARGDYHIRFNPYPVDVFKKGITVYPDVVEEKINRNVPFQL